MHAQGVCAKLRASLCVSACDFDYVCKLLARIIVDEMSTSGDVAKSAGDINRLFTGLGCLSLASDQRTPTRSIQSATT